MEILNFGWPSPLKIHCLGHTSGGFPKHPLYLAEDTKFKVYGGRFWNAGADIWDEDIQAYWIKGV